MLCLKHANAITIYIFIHTHIKKSSVLIVIAIELKSPNTTKRQSMIHG